MKPGTSKMSPRDPQGTPKTPQMEPKVIKVEPKDPQSRRKVSTVSPRASKVCPKAPKVSKKSLNMLQTNWKCQQPAATSQTASSLQQGAGGRGQSP